AQCPDGTAPPCSRGAPGAAATSPPPAERDRARTFLILPFRNLSRIAAYQWLVEASPTMLADALGQWTELTVVPDERLYPALRRHELHPGDVMDLASLRRVAAETGGWTAVTGEIIVTGERLQVSARAYDVVTRCWTPSASTAPSRRHTASSLRSPCSRSRCWILTIRPTATRSAPRRSATGCRRGRPVTCARCAAC